MRVKVVSAQSVKQILLEKNVQQLRAMLLHTVRIMYAKVVSYPTNKVDLLAAVDTCLDAVALW